MPLPIRTGLVLCLGLIACEAIDVVGNTAISCGQASWAQCTDFGGPTGRVPFDPASYGIALHVHSHSTLTGVSCDTSGDCTPYVEDGALLLNAEDTGYGMDVLRFTRPFDFSGREGRIHYRSDLSIANPRMSQVVHVSPTISNTLPDLRGSIALNYGPALTIHFLGDGGSPFSVITWRDGAAVQVLHANGSLGLTPGVLHDVDILVSRTRAQLLLDGSSIFDEVLDDIGFDQGYVYFGQIGIDPAKEGRVGDAANRILWDDLAFDGPLLPANALTPADKQDVLFRPFDATACSARGLAADGPVLPPPGYIYDTWHVQLTTDEPALDVSEISCSQNGGITPAGGQAQIGEIEIIRQ